METLTEEDGMPIGNRLLEMLSRRICVWLVDHMKLKELVKPSCLFSGHSSAPNSNLSINMSMMRDPEKSVLQKSHRSMLGT